MTTDVQRDDHGMTIPRKGSERLGLLKRMGFFSPPGLFLLIRRATILCQFQDAYRLMHDVYVREGCFFADPSGIRLSPFDALPSTAVFFAEREEEIVGAQRAVIDSQDLGLPADAVFKTELDGLRAQGRKIGEMSAEAIVPMFHMGPTPTELLRCVYAYALHEDCHDLVAVVPPGRAHFYMLMGFSIISDIRTSGVIQRPMVLVRMAFDTIERDLAAESDGDFFLSFFFGGNPYRSTMALWQTDALDFFRDEKLMHILFGSLLGRCSQKHREAITRAWAEAKA